MNFNKFLHFNRHCPVCQEPLHLYMYWVPDQNDGLLFKAKQTNPSVYHFKPIESKAKNVKLYPDLYRGMAKNTWDDDPEFPYMALVDHEGYQTTHFSSDHLERESQKRTAYFFFICHPDGLNNDYGGN